MTGSTRPDLPVPTWLLLGSAFMLQLLGVLVVIITREDGGALLIAAGGLMLTFYVCFGSGKTE